MRLLAAAGLAPEEFAFAGQKDCQLAIVRCADPDGEPQLLVCRNWNHYNEWYQALNMREGAAAKIEGAFSALVGIANTEAAGEIQKGQIIDAPGGCVHGHSYQVLAVVMMSAGAAMDPEFKAAVLHSIENDAWARCVNAHGRRFVMSQFWKLVDEYNVNRGHAIQYAQETIDDIRNFGISKYDCERKALALVDGGYTVTPVATGAPIFVPQTIDFDPGFFPMKVRRVTVKRIGASGFHVSGTRATFDRTKPLVMQPEILSLFSQVMGEPTLTKHQLVDKMRLLAAMDPDHVVFQTCPALFDELQIPAGAAKTPNKAHRNGDNDAPTNRPVPKRVSGHLQKQLRSASGFNHNKICFYCSAWRGAHNRQQLMTCSGCKLIYYCNKECQAADWKNHKVACREANRAAAAAGGDAAAIVGK